MPYHNISPESLPSPWFPQLVVHFTFTQSNAEISPFTSLLSSVLLLHRLVRIETFLFQNEQLKKYKVVVEDMTGPHQEVWWWVKAELNPLIYQFQKLVKSYQYIPGTRWECNYHMVVLSTKHCSLYITSSFPHWLTPKPPLLPPNLSLRSSSGEKGAELTQG